MPTSDALTTTALRLLAVTAAGATFGLATNLTTDWNVVTGERIFVADFVFPYLLMPFAAGAYVSRRWWVAVAAGVAVVLAAFVGYYWVLFSHIDAPLYLLFTSGNPWVPFEILTGTVFGWLGHRWRQRGQRGIALFCASLPAVEAVATALGASALVRAIPQLHIAPPDWPWTPWNLTIWVLQLGLSALLVRLALRRDITRGGASARGPVERSPHRAGR